MDSGTILSDFKGKLQSKVDYLHQLDTIIQFMKTQLKNCNDMASLREEIEDTRTKKENLEERNNSLRQVLEENQLKKECVLRELDCARSQEMEVIKDQEARAEHVKCLSKSYVLALGFYKSRLDSHLEYNEDYLVWTFKNISSDSKKKYMVKLVKKDGQWSCTDMVPKLKSRDVLMETLKETNDIQGFLSNVRSRFKKIANLKN